MVLPWINVSFLGEFKDSILMEDNALTQQNTPALMVLQSQ